MQTQGFYRKRIAPIGRQFLGDALKVAHKKLFEFMNLTKSTGRLRANIKKKVVLVMY